jgi:4-carboxymuconolactone decarboxylase
MSERFPMLTPQSMTPEQARVVESIAGTRGGNGARGPFNMWLRVPELADRMQKVGAYIRYEAALPQKLVEFAICITAREWNAAYEWNAHAILAKQEGLATAILQAVADRQRPTGMDAAETAIWEFCTELHAERGVTEPRFAAVRAIFGEAGVTELTATCGYYVAVAMTLNVAQVPLPDDGVPFAV